MSIEDLVRDDFNAMPLQERERVGRFMDYERVKQLRRDRAKALRLVAELDAEIKRAVLALELWSSHETPNV